MNEGWSSQKKNPEKKMIKLVLIALKKKRLY